MIHWKVTSGASSGKKTYVFEWTYVAYHVEYPQSLRQYELHQVRGYNLSLASVERKAPLCYFGDKCNCFL